jgi:hypothetical protein
MGYVMLGTGQVVDSAPVTISRSDLMQRAGAARQPGAFVVAESTPDARLVDTRRRALGSASGERTSRRN